MTYALLKSRSGRQQRARDEELARFAAAEAHFFDDHKPLGLELSHYALAVDPERSAAPHPRPGDLRPERARAARRHGRHTQADIRVASAEDLKVFPQF